MYIAPITKYAPKNKAVKLLNIAVSIMCGPKYGTSVKNKLEAAKAIKEPRTAIIAKAIKENFLLILLHLRICMIVSINL